MLVLLDEAAQARLVEALVKFTGKEPHCIRRIIDGAVGDELNLSPLARSALDLPIVALELSVRAENICKNEDIVSLRNLATVTEAEWLGFPGANRRSLNEIKESLARYELRLGLKLLMGDT